MTTYAADVISVPTDAQATVIVDGSDDGQQEQIETETTAAEVKTGYWFSDSMQLMLYDDGTYSMLEGDVYQSGNWIKGAGGVTLQYNGGERVVMLDGSGLVHSDGTIVWQLPTLVITVGDTVQPPSLGSGFTVSGGELDTSQTGDFNVQYTVTDEAIGKQFSLARTVIIQDVQVQTERPIVDYEPEQPTTEPETETHGQSETQRQEQPTTESETQAQEQPTTEPVVIGGEHANQETEGKPQGSGFSKVFTVMTPGGTMTVSNSAGQLLATIEYGQSYTIDTVQNANDGIDDVTIELVAADGYVVDGLEHLATAGEVKAAAWCPSMIGTKSFNRGAYLTQLASDEEYNAYFCLDGDFQYVDPNEISLFAVSSLDSAEVGTQFSGRATLTSINSPAGHTYNGSGVISCTSGELSGHNFTMSTCETGHSGAIPLAGQTGSYTATVKSIDRKNGSISLFIYWANDSTPIGNYQSLSTSTSINHSFQGEIGVNKTSASADARVTNSAYYSLANAEFTLYKNYDSKTKKLSGVVSKLTTNEDGQATKTLTVDAGTYYMKETKAPRFPT
ncbi:MAG: SpaA isopeptide-forming pilin-related protein [Blautia sp.]